MQLRIGIAQASSPELVIDLPPEDVADDVTHRFNAAADSHSGLVWFVDRHGARYGVPFRQVNYIELSP